MLKKMWITEQSRDNFSLSFESNDPEKNWNRIYTRELLFPATPTIEHPLRHTVILGNFDLKELVILKETLDNFLDNI